MRGIKKLVVLGLMLAMLLTPTIVEAKSSVPYMKVPNVLGVSGATGVARLKAAGFRVYVSPGMYSNTYKARTIAAQGPLYAYRGQCVWVAQSVGKKPVSKRVFLGTFRATGYSYSYNDSGAGGSDTCANGMPVGEGDRSISNPARIAVDPREIRLGTKLYVEGYGYAIAADTGGAIKGHHIDLFFASKGAMNSWGGRYVKVFLRK